jgi:ribosomal protein S18 acetylase RimI-like enzyme
LATHREPLLSCIRLTDLPTPSVLELLKLESRLWTERLRWDAGELVDALGLAARARLLPGAAVLRGGHAVAYLSWHVGRGVFRPCSVFIREEAGPEAVELLVQACVDAAAGLDLPIETQLSAFDAQEELDEAFRGRGVHVERRQWLGLDLRVGADSPDRGEAGAPALFPLMQADLPDCAALLVRSHHGGIEARINAAFRDEGAALQYLEEVHRGPGCGRLLPEASLKLVDEHGIQAFCLGTAVSEGVAHLPQVVASPDRQGQGLAGRLLSAQRRSLQAGGFKELTLSVSRANERAAGWYRRLGFRELAPLSAYVPVES